MEVMEEVKQHRHSKIVRP